MDEFGQALLVAAALSALGVLTAIVALIARAVALQRSIARVAAGTLSREAALARSRRLARTMLQIVALVAVVPSILVSLAPSFEGGYLYLFDPHLELGVFVFVNSITLYTYSTLVAALLLPPTGRALRGVTLTRSASLPPTLKLGALTYIPFVLTGVGIAVSFANGWALGVWLFCLMAVASNAARMLFRGHVQRLVYPTRLADASTSPGLVDRVALWAARCGVAPPQCRIQQTNTFGSAFIVEIGVFDRTFLITDNTLADMDWRQQDACVVRAIEGNKLASRHSRFVINMMTWVYGAIGLLFTALQPAVGPASASLFAMALLLYAPLLYRTQSRTARDSVLRLDRIAAEVTGDPLAVMVGMKTLATLNIPSGEWSTTGTPAASLDDRMRALDAWMQQSGPRAPWAYQPVPSR